MRATAPADHDTHEVMECERATGNEEGSCRRSSDHKVFKLPRKFSRMQCRTFVPDKMGFTQRASCAPWREPTRIADGRRNLRGAPLAKCAEGTGYFRDGYCMPDDAGNHVVCARMTDRFMEYARDRGNDLYRVTAPGRKWCVCKGWWERAQADGHEPELVASATHASAAGSVPQKSSQPKQTSS